MFYLPFRRPDLASDSDNPPATVGREALKRVIVVGTSGSGKTTFARALASKMGVPHVEFDAYRHGPNWTETPNDVFRQKLSEALSGPSVGGGWELQRRSGCCLATRHGHCVARLPVSPDLLEAVPADHRQAVRRTELWNGNRESLWEHLFTRDSLLLWAIQTHWSRRRRYRVTFKLPEYNHLTVFHVRRARAADALLDSIAQGVKNTESVA